MQVLCSSLLPTVDRLHRMLSPYVGDVTRFRLMQRATGAVLSGPFVQLFMDCLPVRGRLRPKELPVYVPGRSVLRWLGYLRWKEKYTAQFHTYHEGPWCSVSAFLKKSAV